MEIKFLLVMAFVVYSMVYFMCISIRVEIIFAQQDKKCSLVKRMLISLKVLLMTCYMFVNLMLKGLFTNISVFNIFWQYNFEIPNIIDGCAFKISQGVNWIVVAGDVMDYILDISKNEKVFNN